MTLISVLTFCRQNGFAYLRLACWWFVLDQPVKGRAVDAEALRAVTHVIGTVGHQGPGQRLILRCELGRSAAVLPACTSGLQSSHRPLTDQVTFELSKSGEEVKDQLALG